uniref:histone acetyltransferase n=1 Tax=Opuntia streptacantha TaxID=393608 RepID=A0A7C9DZ41_OPUST
MQVRELLDVVLHASHCQTTSRLCSYPNCTLIRRLFSHAHACKVRVAGGCHHCRKTWFILMMHSRRCKDSDCSVPRCLDLKKYADRLELQFRTRRSNNPPDVHWH